jgi:hypothetical protein
LLDYNPTQHPKNICIDICCIPPRLHKASTNANSSFRAQSLANKQLFNFYFFGMVLIF